MWQAALVLVGGMPVADAADHAQDPVRLEPGVTLEGVLDDDAPRIRTPALDGRAEQQPTVGVVHALRIERPGTFTLDLQSYAFDAYLVLRSEEGEILAEDDDGGVSIHARVVAQLDADTDYEVVACGLHGGRGSFQLSLRTGGAVALDPDEQRAADREDAYRRLEWVGEEYGEDSVVYADALESLGVSLFRMGDFDAIDELWTRALTIREEQLGPLHPQTTKLIQNFGVLRFEQGRYGESIPFMERAISNRGKELGPDHLSLAGPTAELALAYARNGRLADAVEAGQRALSLYEAAERPDPDGLASVLTKLGLIRERQGRLAEAAEYHERALHHWQETLAPGSPKIADSLNNLGMVNVRRERLAEAEPLLERAVEIYEAALGPDDMHLGTALNNLALLYRSRGRIHRAEELFRRALSIMEAALGPDHVQVATVLGNLAQAVELDGGRHDESSESFERVLTIRERAFGPEHPSVASSLNDLAGIEIARGRHDRAEELLIRAIRIQEGALGARHPQVAQSLLNLGACLFRSGRYEEAERHHRRARDIREEAFGSESIQVARAQDSLAAIVFAQGRLGEASELRLEAARSTLAFLGRELPTLPEAARFRLLAMVSRPNFIMLRVAETEPHRVSELFDLCLAWKGYLTRLQKASLALSRRASEPAVAARVGRLRELQSDLARLVLLPQGGQSAGHAERIEALRTERIKVERELNRELETARFLRALDHRQLQAFLPEDTVFLDFLVGMNVYAWVLRPSGPPQLISVAPASEVRAAVQAFLRGTVTRGGAPLDAGEGRPDSALRRLLWDPVSEAVGGAKTVLLSPDRFLCELPFGVLQDDDGRYLIESHRFVYLGDGSVIARSDSGIDERAGSILLVGDIDYYRAEEPAAEQEQDGARRGGGSLRSRLGETWSLLPSTRDELRAIRELREHAVDWTTPLLTLTGAAATEAGVRQALPGHRYVHIATHGYFEPDHLPSLVRDAEQRSSDRLGEQLQAVGLLPGLLSGLVFAGVNSDPDPARDDGYLSAEEIQNLDLAACDLAILSACETALGSERAGEGLMSLRRAFEVAGAKTVISSLWRVDDRATAQLMKWFYENYWVEGMEKNEALHQAKLRMLRQNRADFQGAARPRTWGAFVLSGDWR